MPARGVLPAGTELAGYAIEGVLGRGGMATVYRARHPARAEPVALKVIDPEQWGEERLARFRREAQLARAVVHRHILPVYEAGEHGGVPFVAMKLEDGDLAKLLRREGRLSPSRAARLVSQVASALDAAHAHGLVHRDVKASNVLLEEGAVPEHVYVADFGIARAAFTGDVLSGGMVGTVGYASPEQIRGEPVDHRADVYGLGCLLYECITGRVPFAEKASLTTLWAHLHDEPPAPSLLVPQTPPALDAVVARALAKEPRARYGSAGALAEAVLAVVDGRRRTRERVPAEPRSLPSGTVTFLFTDVEGSTRLLHELGEDRYAHELEEHRRIVRAACAGRGGVEVDTQGDAFFFAFSSAPAALAAASALTSELAAGSIRVRVGLHTGTPHVTTEGYVGIDVHRAARIAGAAHGGQVVVSQHTHALLQDSGALRSLGAHRLRDFEEPLTLFQLGDGSFPPLKTIANTNLPTPGSTFLGRESELREADRLLRATRVLTVTGPGGAGKTRFALELARRAREERFSDHEDGVFACFLAPLRDPVLVLPTLAQTLSVPEQHGGSALDALVSHLREKELLLLLDNLEHVLECAPELAGLVSACPGLRLLVTSRERLRVAGEVTYELPPLATDQSVLLFCERAGIEPTPATRDLCARLDGLPLAIELAAARMTLLSPEQLLERLAQRLDLLRGPRDADARQQTLRATIQWSYDLLAPDEQRVFKAFSVFRGGCTLEAAETVVDADIHTLESLLDKSLLRRMETEPGPRLWMLETIREVAWELLEADGSAPAVLRRHALHYASVARSLEPLLRGSEGASAIARLDLDLDNYRLALSHALETSEPELALQLAADLGFYWQWCGRTREGEAWLRQALAEPEVGSASLRARALNWLAVSAMERGDMEASRELNERSLDLARAAGDAHAEAAALHDLAGSYGGLGLLDESVDCFENARALFEQLDEESGVVSTLSNTGVALRRLGRLEDARVREQEAVRRARRLGNDHFLVVSLCELGIIELELAQRDEAGAHLREALRVARGSGDLFDVHWILWALVVEACRAGASARAARLAGAAERAMHDVGAELDPFDAAWVEDALAAARADLGDAAFEEARAEGAAFSPDEAVAYGLESVALVA